ncbi:MAG TPA: hypothetical protein VN922_24550, partial [Bacteroidia bacterium]|nr:hypothetical protein [Bacteroidia bacterium]
WFYPDSVKFKGTGNRPEDPFTLRLDSPATGTNIFALFVRSDGYLVRPNINYSSVTNTVTYSGLKINANGGIKTNLSLQSGRAYFVKQDSATGDFKIDTALHNGGGGSTGANPTATAGASPVNGSAPTFMRSDAAPKVDSGSFRTVANSYTLSALQTKFNLYPLKTTTVAGFALSGNVTLANHVPGYGLSGSNYNGSGAQTWAVDTTLVATPYYANWVSGPDGVVSGMTPVTVSGTTATVPLGVYRLNDVLINKGSSTNVTIDAQDATQNRIDLIVGDGAGALTRVQGTLAPDAVQPDVPSGKALISVITIPATGGIVTTGGGGNGKGTVTNVSSSTTDILVKNNTTTPVITLNKVNGVSLSFFDPTSSIQTQLNGKQAALVSATNIKTVNSVTLLGSGNLAITTANTDTTSTGFATNAKLSTYLTKAQVVATYVPQATTVAGFALSSNVTLGTLTLGNGLLGTSYNPSGAATAKLDTSIAQTVLNFFPKGDTRYQKILTAGIGITISGTTISASGGSGITNLNTLTGSTQTFATGTSGTDFGISSSGTTHTFNLPSASTSNRGLLSSFDYTNINQFNGVWKPMGVSLRGSDHPTYPLINDVAAAGEPTLLYEKHTQLLSHIDTAQKIFKMWYTGGDTYTGGGDTYGTRYAEGIALDRMVPDPNVCIVGRIRNFVTTGPIAGLHYMFTADASGNSIRCDTSTSGKGGTWGIYVTSVFAKGGTGYRQSAVQNCSGFWDGTNWNFMVEGQNISGVFALGYWSGTSLSSMTDYAGNPVISYHSSGGPDFKKIGGVYYCWFHAGKTSGSNVPSDIYRAHASSPTGTWTIDNSSNPVYSRAMSDEGVRTTTGGVSDMNIVEDSDNGVSYLVYTKQPDETTSGGVIAYARANYSLANLVTTNEGNGSAFYPATFDQSQVDNHYIINRSGVSTAQYGSIYLKSSNDAGFVSILSTNTAVYGALSPTSIDFYGTSSSHEYLSFSSTGITFNANGGSASLNTSGLFATTSLEATGLSTTYGVLYTSNGSGLISQTTAGISGYVLTSNGSGSAPTFQPSVGLPSMTGNSGKFLTTDGTSASWVINSGLTNPMTGTGDLIYGGSSGAATRLAPNNTTSQYFLTQTGNGSSSNAPSWVNLFSGSHTWSSASGTSFSVGSLGNLTLTGTNPYMIFTNGTYGLNIAVSS